MRLKVLIVLVIIYILAAFAWLTFSLLNYSNTDYKLKNDVLKAGLNACILQVVQNAKNGNLGQDSVDSYYLKQLQLDLDPTQLERFVFERFDNNYVIQLSEIEENRNIVQISINPNKLKGLETERMQQRNIWLYQSILLLVLVAAGIFGVYYSIDSIYKLNKRQNNFLLSVTHEFKTPIAAIRLMLQTSKNPKVKDDKKNELVDKSILNTYRLEELAENMLTAMQIENKKYQYSIGDVDLSEMVQQVVSNQKIKGDINANVEEDIKLNGDGFILRMVINNLVENAFKYSGNQPIDVSLFKKGDKKVLEIKDVGIGINKEDYKNIFKKFYRVQDEETRTTKGTGLGLFIVKQAIERHGGKVSVSANKPKGSVFTIVLP
ncbi:MAG: HAMP domain-containing histidine kinase [Bacteroidia bacterium]|nr:HAMP domain-containing histidine kinase [Bacteroidia bacterium]NNJ54798.1 HAMP domain-containing histidine kinase [Bacteroidia bacterium]